MVSSGMASSGNLRGEVFDLALGEAMEASRRLPCSFALGFVLLPEDAADLLVVAFQGFEGFVGDALL
jgi:hypothetical protein